MTPITSKELGSIVDQLHLEENLVKKFQAYAGKAVMLPCRIAITKLHPVIRSTMTRCMHCLTVRRAETELEEYHHARQRKFFR